MFAEWRSVSGRGWRPGAGREAQGAGPVL